MHDIFMISDFWLISNEKLISHQVSTLKVYINILRLFTLFKMITINFNTLKQIVRRNKSGLNLLLVLQRNAIVSVPDLKCQLTKETFETGGNQARQDTLLSSCLQNSKVAQPKGSIKVRVRVLSCMVSTSFESSQTVI